MIIEQEVRLLTSDRKFRVDVEENGFVVRDGKTQEILMDGSTMFRDGGVTFAPKDFTIRHRKSKMIDGKHPLYEYYELWYKR